MSVAEASRRAEARVCCSEARSSFESASPPEENICATCPGLVRDVSAGRLERSGGEECFLERGTLVGEERREDAASGEPDVPDRTAEGLTDSSRAPASMSLTLGLEPAGAPGPASSTACGGGGNGSGAGGCGSAGAAVPVTSRNDWALG